MGNVMELVLPLLQNSRVLEKEKELAGGRLIIRVEEEFMLTEVGYLVSELFG
jgi:predicted transcriptional regulator